MADPIANNIALFMVFNSSQDAHLYNDGMLYRLVYNRNWIFFYRESEPMCADMREFLIDTIQTKPADYELHSFFTSILNEPGLRHAYLYYWYPDVIGRLSSDTDNHVEQQEVPLSNFNLSADTPEDMAIIAQNFLGNTAAPATHHNYFRISFRVLHDQKEIAL